MTADETGRETPVPAPSGNASGGNAQSAPGATQAAQETRPQLGIRTQYIKDLSFENPSTPNRSPEAERAPDIQVNVQVQVGRLDQTNFEVTLQITANARHEEKPVFLVELTYAGVFTLVGIPQEALEPTLLVECPRLLFPFARRIVADVTRDGASPRFPPLLLGPDRLPRALPQRPGPGGPGSGASGRRAGSRGNAARGRAGRESALRRRRGGRRLARPSHRTVGAFKENARPLKIAC